MSGVPLYTQKERGGGGAQRRSSELVTGTESCSGWVRCLRFGCVTVCCASSENSCLHLGLDPFSGLRKASR